MARRDPLQVSPNFRIRLIKMQGNLNAKSIRELTEKIASSGVLDDIEKKLLKMAMKNPDVEIKFDRRVK